MPKKLVSRDDLQEMVISAIRQRPGCEGVLEISVSSVNIVGGESTWRASIIDNGTASLETAYHAAARITEEYTREYQLADSLVKTQVDDEEGRRDLP